MLLDPMFDTPGSNIRTVYIDEHVVDGSKKAEYVLAPEEEAPNAEANEEQEEIYAGDVSSRA